jgi:hypothetical protein
MQATHATQFRTSRLNTVNTLPTTAMLPAVATDPATATLPEVAAECATATLSCAVIEPGIGPSS